MSTEKTFHVYSLYRADGLLLYVGQTNNIKRRVADHKRAWYGNTISTFASEGFATRRDAMVRETALINSHRPPWNLTARPLVTA